MGILTEKKVPAPTIVRQDILPDTGGSLLPPETLKNTVPVTIYYAKDVSDENVIRTASTFEALDVTGDFNYVSTREMVIGGLSNHVVVEEIRSIEELKSKVEGCAPGKAFIRYYDVMEDPSQKKIAAAKLIEAGEDSESTSIVPMVGEIVQEIQRSDLIIGQDRRFEAIVVLGKEEKPLIQATVNQEAPIFQENQIPVDQLQNAVNLQGTDFFRPPTSFDDLRNN